MNFLSHFTLTFADSYQHLISDYPFAIAVNSRAEHKNDKRR